MSKTKSAKPAVIPITCEAVTSYRSTDFTYESLRLTIVDGMVVDVNKLTRGPDMANIAIGKAQKILWQNNTKQNIKSVYGEANG